MSHPYDLAYESRREPMPQSERAPKPEDPLLEKLNRLKEALKIVLETEDKELELLNSMARVPWQQFITMRNNVSRLHHERKERLAAIRKNGDLE